MPSVAPGVSELRLHSEDGQFRAFYFTASTEAVSGKPRVRQEDAPDSARRNPVGQEAIEGAKR